MRLGLILACACLFAGLTAGCGRRTVVRDEWPVMGTVAAVQTRGHDAVAFAASVRTRAQGCFAAIEKLLNAHDPDSELSRLATKGDDEILSRCSPSVRPCYAAAFRLAELSGGAFNPRFRGPNTLDLGAIAKGFAVDCAAKESPAGGSALLDLGGNLKSLVGDWKTGVKDPSDTRVAAAVDLHAGEALATSAAYYRGNHIVDGRRGQPATNGVASVTVLCRSAMWADGLSTLLFILGPDEGRAFLDNHLSDLEERLAASVLWIMTDGTHHTYGDARFQGN